MIFKYMDILNKNNITPLPSKGKKRKNGIKIPYGNDYLVIESNDLCTSDQILPNEINVTKKRESRITEKALDCCIGKDEDKLFSDQKHKVAIAVNDQTRPIPNKKILPPLLKKIETYGIPSENISLFIATGTHKGLNKKEIRSILRHEIAEKYRVKVHDCDNMRNLTFLGYSVLGTPIFINKDYYLHEIKMVVGHIEPHHFMGFSGGVKSAVIGLGGRKTIETNHSHILDPKAKMGVFCDNPMRNDIEEIGRIIGIDIAFNVILNSKKQITNAFYGDPYEVMKNGIEMSDKICHVNSYGDYDLVIASPGGYPKDINFYQSQKAITHACSFLKKKGVVILVAECRRGAGSRSFEKFLAEKHTWREVINKFENQEFRVGPHKAYLLALQLKDHPIILISNIKPKLVRDMHITPARDLSEAISLSKDFLPKIPRIAILPYATHTLKRKPNGL